MYRYDVYIIVNRVSIATIQADHVINAIKDAVNVLNESDVLEGDTVVFKPVHNASEPIYVNDGRDVI